MKRQLGRGSVMLVLGLMASPVISSAETLNSDPATEESGETVAYQPSVPVSDESNDPAEYVRQYDLSGPRAGITFAGDGTARSQFGWHFEHQATPTTHGPWFVVETVLLASGVEAQTFVPGGTVIFGIRLPTGVEFGIGPNAVLGGPGFMRSSLVVAAGRSFKFGGISVPVNVAVATNHDGSRFSVLTGWAIRHRAAKRSSGLPFEISPNNPNTRLMKGST
jgi:hypothetical protein